MCAHIYTPPTFARKLVFRFSPRGRDCASQIVRRTNVNCYVCLSECWHSHERIHSNGYERNGFGKKKKEKRKKRVCPVDSRVAFWFCNLFCLSVWFNAYIHTRAIPRRLRWRNYWHYKAIRHRDRSAHHVVIVTLYVTPSRTKRNLLPINLS